MATPTRRSVRSAALKRPLFSPIRGADAATSSASASSSATSVRAAIGESSSSTQLAQRIFSPTRRVQLRARRGQQNQQSHNASPNARSSPILLRAAKCKASPAKGRHTAAAAKAQTAPVASSAAAAKSKPKPKPKQYEVECIRAIRRVGGGSQSGEREYLLKWRGYAESENTWEPLSSLGSSCMSLLREFEASKQRKQHGGGDKPNGGHRDVEDDACVNPWREEEISALFQSYAHTAPTTKGFWSHVAQSVASRSASKCQEKYEEQFERVERDYALDADAENASQLNDSNVAPAESDSVEEKLQQFQTAAPQQRTAMIQEFLAKDGHSRINHADDLLAASLFSPTSANAFSSCLDSHRDPFSNLAFHSGVSSRRPHGGFAQPFASVVGSPSMFRFEPNDAQYLIGRIKKKPQCSDTAAHRPSFKQQSKVASRTASSSSSFESRAARELRIALKNMRVDDEARREHAANLEDEIVDRFDASASASGHYSARQDIFNDGDNDNHGATFAETEFDFESEL